MIHELREYKLKPGRLAEYLDHVDNKVQRLRGNRFGRLVAFFRASSGDTERVIHIWEYDSLNARQDARLQLASNVGWMGEFIASVWPIIEYQKVTFLDVEELTSPVPRSGGEFYLLRRCEAATGQTQRASQLLLHMPVEQGATVGRYLSISPDANTALDLVRIDPEVPAAEFLKTADRLTSAMRGQDVRSVQVEILSPVATSLW